MISNTYCIHPHSNLDFNHHIISYLVATSNTNAITLRKFSSKHKLNHYTYCKYRRKINMSTHHDHGLIWKLTYIKCNNKCCHKKLNSVSVTIAY